MEIKWIEEVVNFANGGPLTFVAKKNADGSFNLLFEKGKPELGKTVEVEHMYVKVEADGQA